MYDVSQQEIISFLNETGNTEENLHSNSKLDEQTEALVAKHFGISPEMSTEEQDDQGEETSEEIEQNTLESDVVDKEKFEDVPSKDLEDPLSIAKDQQPHKKDEVAIETDQLLELLESEDTPVDLDKITLIKAPKKELDGLKVVGKIDLPEPKLKIEEETDQSETGSDDYSSDKHKEKSRQRRRLVTDEELEERRLKAKRKKEENEARQEERRKAREKKKRKAIREAHYKKKMQQIKSSQPKITKTETQPESFEEEEARPEPKTIFGKFWRWMNTP
jgi:hypothetical protein